MAALVVRAINQETANASGSHLGEGNFRARGHWHAPMIPPIWPDVKPPLGVVVRFLGVHRVIDFCTGAPRLPVRRKRFLRNVARQVPQSRGDERGASCASPVSLVGGARFAVARFGLL